MFVFVFVFVFVRHVILTREKAKLLPNPQRLLSEAEWRGLGVQQSRGWVHYEIHRPEPHILLFRRPLGTDPITGKVIAPPAANTNANQKTTQNAQTQQTQQFQQKVRKQTINTHTHTQSKVLNKYQLAQ